MMVSGKSGFDPRKYLKDLTKCVPNRDMITLMTTQDNIKMGSLETNVTFNPKIVMENYESMKKLCGHDDILLILGKNGYPLFIAENIEPFRCIMVVPMVARGAKLK